MEDLGSLWGTFWAKAIRRWCNYNTCKYYCNLFYPLSTAGWFPGKQSLKWNLACRVFIEMCPWEQHLWKGWWEVEFAWHREKSSTQPATASAAHREFWSWNALHVQSHSTLCNPPTVAQQPLCIVPSWIKVRALTPGLISYSAWVMPGEGLTLGGAALCIQGNLCRGW